VLHVALAQAPTIITLVLLSPCLRDRSVSAATSAPVEVLKLEFLAPTLAGARVLRSLILELLWNGLALSS